MYKIKLLYVLLFFFCFSFLYAEKITFSANKMTGKTGNSSDTTTLTGNAFVLTSTMEIAADSITMTGKDFRYIEASGNITGKNTETKMEFTCGKLSYDRETKIATLREDVNLDDIENKVNVKAQIVEYNQETDIAIIQVDITLTQKDNICNSAYAIYRKKTQMLELSGNSQIKQGEDTFRAQEITLNLDTQDITLDGRVKGSVVDNRAEKTTTENNTQKGDIQNENTTAKTEEVKEETQQDDKGKTNE